MKFYFQEKEKVALPVASMRRTAGILLSATIGHGAAFCQNNDRENGWTTGWLVKMYYLYIGMCFKK